MKTDLLPTIEILETRIALAVHTWTGAGADNFWSNGANWTGGSPDTDASGDVDLVFPTGAEQLEMENDILALLVDSITFNAAGGTSADGYTIHGNTIFINAAAAGQNPFGIDVLAGVADLTDGITQTFNVGISLFINDATFRTAETGSRLTFNGPINLGLNTLTIDNVGNGTTVGVAIHGDILTNGNIIKNGTGTLQLTGNNNHFDTTINNGNIFADSNGALGGSDGTVTINDPARLLLHNGVTVAKTLLNLNSNGLGGGLGADGNTTNVWRGSVLLMAGSGGVSMGAGIGTANANTRLIVDGVISGATSTLSLNGAGVIEFTQDNTYTGRTNQNGNNGFGAIQIDSPGGLGAGGAGNETQLNRNGAGPTGSALWLNFDGALQDGGAVGERIEFAGSGVGGLGAVRVLGDHDVVLSGNITFIAGAPWTFGADSGGSITTTGIIDSQGANRPLTKVGAGTLIIGGVSANTFAGGVSVNGGVLSVENNTANPVGTTGIVLVSKTSVLQVTEGFTNTFAVLLNPGGTLAGDGVITGLVVASNGIVSPGTGAGTLQVNGALFNSASTFLVDINGLVAGSQHDQLRVNGTVNLGGATLALTGAFTSAPGQEITLIVNDGVEAITGTFAGLNENARVAAGGQIYTISYTGGTNSNDVVLTAVTPLSDLDISTNGRTATFTDADGDLVTVKVTKGTLAASDFIFGFTADNRQQLQRLTLDGLDAGTNVTITAKRTALGGDGFANVGHIGALGVALGTVSINGDLGRIDAGAVKSLTVQSLGALGVASQTPFGSVVSNLTGNLGKLTVKASIHGVTLLGTGSIGPVNVLGSILGGRLSAGADLGAVSVRGDIIGTDAAPVIISGFGKAVAPTKGTDLAIKSLKVSGGVEFLRVLAGYDLALTGKNADASTGAISVGADWRASTVLAGVDGGADGFAGTADDAKLTTAGVRDTATIFSTIASLTIKGQAFGSTGSGDNFGIAAEQIKQAKVGKITFKLDKGERDAADAFALAPTGPGATGLASDFFLREVTI